MHRIARLPTRPQLPPPPPAPHRPALQAQPAVARLAASLRPSREPLLRGCFWAMALQSALAAALVWRHPGHGEGALVPLYVAGYLCVALLTGSLGKRKLRSRKRFELEVSWGDGGVEQVGWSRWGGAGGVGQVRVLAWLGSDGTYEGMQRQATGGKPCATLLGRRVGSGMWCPGRGVTLWREG